MLPSCNSLLYNITWSVCVLVWNKNGCQCDNTNRNRKELWVVKRQKDAGVGKTQECQKKEEKGEANVTGQLLEEKLSYECQELAPNVSWSREQSKSPFRVQLSTATPSKLTKKRFAAIHRSTTELWVLHFSTQRESNTWPMESCLEKRGIEPRTCRMQSGRATTVPHPLVTP